MRHRSTCTKSERGKPFKTSLSLQLLLAPAYSGEETGRMMVKLSSTTQIIDLLSHLSHNLPQETCGKLAPWPSHGSRDSSRTQACIYKAEGEDLSPPLLLQLIPAPAYPPTNTLRSTIGDEVLNCQVRHGAGCVHLSMSTGNFSQPLRLCYISSIRSCGIKPALDRPQRIYEVKASAY